MNVGDNVTIASNTTITIRCPVSGIPKATVTWQRDGSHVAEGDRYSIKDDKSLVIEGEWVEERAKYTCIVQSKFGMDETSSYVMIIGNLSFLLHLTWYLMGFITNENNLTLFLLSSITAPLASQNGLVCLLRLAGKKV